MPQKCPMPCGAIATTGGSKTVLDLPCPVEWFGLLRQLSEKSPADRYENPVKRVLSCGFLPPVPNCRNVIDTAAAVDCRTPPHEKTPQGGLAGLWKFEVL